MISQERFYDSIFTWQYLIRNGYFDYRNSNALYKGEVSNDYGRDDIIDPRKLKITENEKYTL